MNPELITVVIPVYNTAQYVGECIESLLCQSYKNINIICVDDGSTDNSKEVIHDYVNKDKRVSYFYKENYGAASARNYGIDLFYKDENSNLLTFVDSDDIVKQDYVETLYNLLNQYNADVACLDMNELSDPEVGNKQTRLYTKQEVLYEYFQDRIFRESPVCKLFRKKTFDTLRFPDGKHFEDTFITYRLIETFKNVAHINYYAYKIRMRENSLTRNVYSNDNYDKVEAGLEIYDYYKKSEYENLAYNKYLGILFYFILKTNKNKNSVSKNRTAVDEAKEIVKKNGFKNAGIRFYPFILLTMLNLIDKVSI